MNKVIKNSIAFALLMVCVNINAQVVLDSNLNTLTYDNTTEGVTITNVFICIKGSGGVVLENGKKTVCPNKTNEDVCAELSLIDAIRYKIREWFSSPDRSGEGENEEFTLQEELTVSSQEDNGRSFVFRKGSSFVEISEGVFQTPFANLTIARL